MLESGIGRAHNIHLASLPNFRLPGDIAASKRYYDPDLIEPAIEVAPDGTIPVPTGPGIGVTVVRERVERAAERHRHRRPGAGSMIGRWTRVVLIALLAWLRPRARAAGHGRAPAPDRRAAAHPIPELENQRVARGPAPYQDMILMLGDEQAHIRRRAALGVGRARLTEAVAPLSTMVASETDPEVRQMAAFALGLIGSPDGAEPLVAALGDAEALVQGARPVRSA
ncbi:MAG: HEAT repeat domain-containing protein [Vicinamibacterales bacterium]